MSKGQGKIQPHFQIGVIKVRVTDWYKNGSSNAFRKFCIQSRKKLVSIKLVKGSEPVKGILYRYRFLPFESAGIYLLLTNVANHPAFYSLYDIESLHHLDSVSSILNRYILGNPRVFQQTGLSCLDVGHSSLTQTINSRIPSDSIHSL
jgi:hypothetical protein